MARQRSAQNRRTKRTRADQAAALAAAMSRFSALFRTWGKEGGKIGGPTGGKARMAQLTREQRRALAKKAAAARWAQTPKKPTK